jgi:hypothetical protein
MVSDRASSRIKKRKLSDVSPGRSAPAAAGAPGDGHATDSDRDDNDDVIDSATSAQFPLAATPAWTVGDLQLLSHSCNVPEDRLLHLGLPLHL